VEIVMCLYINETVLDIICITRSLLLVGYVGER